MNVTSDTNKSGYSDAEVLAPIIEAISADYERNSGEKMNAFPAGSNEPNSEYEFSLLNVSENLFDIFATFECKWLGMGGGHNFGAAFFRSEYSRETNSEHLVLESVVQYIERESYVITVNG